MAWKNLEKIKLSEINHVFVCVILCVILWAVVIRPAADGKLCRLSVRYNCRVDSLLNLPSGSCARRKAYMTCNLDLFISGFVYSPVYHDKYGPVHKLFQRPIQAITFMTVNLYIFYIVCWLIDANKLYFTLLYFTNLPSGTSGRQIR